VAVYNHYKRLKSDDKDGVELAKSNILLSPTGSARPCWRRHWRGY